MVRNQTILLVYDKTGFTSAAIMISHCHVSSSLFARIIGIHVCFLQFSIIAGVRFLCYFHVQIYREKLTQRLVTISSIVLISLFVMLHISSHSFSPYVANIVVSSIMYILKVSIISITHYHDTPYRTQMCVH